MSAFTDDGRPAQGQPRATYKQFKDWSDEEWARQELGHPPSESWEVLSRHFNVPVWTISAWADRYRKERMKAGNLPKGFK